MSDVITAPWTPEQVTALNTWQQSGTVHPFTCANRSEPGHSWRWSDYGTLVATVDGWMCPDCDYRQNWAHAMMLRTPPRFPI